MVVATSVAVVLSSTVPIAQHNAHMLAPHLMWTGFSIHQQLIISASFCNCSLIHIYLHFLMLMVKGYQLSFGTSSIVHVMLYSFIVIKMYSRM